MLKIPKFNKIPKIKQMDRTIFIGKLVVKKPASKNVRAEENIAGNVYVCCVLT